jgi:primary-amine oxidase
MNERPDNSLSVKASPIFSHPLDPLTADELTRAAALLRSHFDVGSALLFETIELLEPCKDVVRDYLPGMPIDRKARFNVHKRGSTGVWCGCLDLGAGTILKVEFLADARPMISPEEFMIIEDVAKADPRFRQALLRRGIETMEHVCVDPWSAGNFSVPGEENRRLAHTFVWLRMSALDNYYAHPVEGLNVVVDVDRLEVLRVDDHSAASGTFVPVPQTQINYDSELLTDFRKPLKPLDVVQSEGPSFTLEGNKLSWDNWDLRISFNDPARFQRIPHAYFWRLSQPNSAATDGHSRRCGAHKRN